MQAALTQQDARKLAAILARTGSSFDGEKVAAANAATRFIRDRNLTWSQVVVPLSTPQLNSRPDSSKQSWHEDLAVALRHSDCLTVWERDFAASMQLRRIATPKQQEVLRKIGDRLRARERT